MNPLYTLHTLAGSTILSLKYCGSIELSPRVNKTKVENRFKATLK